MAATTNFYIITIKFTESTNTCFFLKKYSQSEIWGENYIDRDKKLRFTRCHEKVLTSLN